MTEWRWIFISYFILNTYTHERACILPRTDIYIQVLWGSLFLADIQRVLTEWLILKHYKSSNRMSSQLTFDPKAERRTAIMIWYYIQSLIGKHYFQYFKCITAFHESLRKNWKLFYVFFPSFFAPMLYYKLVDVIEYFIKFRLEQRHW